MPDLYCIDKNLQPDGSHEIHLSYLEGEKNCSRLPNPSEQENLGWWVMCKGSIEQAGANGYRQVTGCPECCPEINRLSQHRMDNAINAGIMRGRRERRQ